MSEYYHILLTGAAGGIGSTIARHFAADGHSLLLTDINSGPLEKLAEQLRSEHGAEWKQALEALKGYPSLVKMMFDAPAHTGGQISERASAAGLKKP